MMNDEHVAQLKSFIQQCKAMPQMLHHPSLDFFKEYIISLGGTIPEGTFKPNPPPPTQEPKTEDVPAPGTFSSDESEPEPDPELDMEGVIEGDKIESSQEFGDPNKASTEEEIEESNTKRSAAMQLFGEQKYEEAIQMYTEAIKVNPQSALLFAKRAQAYLKLNKPNACIKDCTHALELNCDSAASYKFRGRARRLLGDFEQAAADLRESCKIDYDEQAQEWLLEVTPNAEKLRLHHLNVQRRQEEKEHKEKLKRYQQAKAAHASAAQGKKDEAGEGFPEGMGGGAPPGFNMADSLGFLNDPEILASLKDPEVAAALKDVTANPENIFKYQSNPKVANILKKIATMFGGGGMPGMPGMGGFGGMGGMPGFPGAPPQQTPFGQGAPSDDVGLD